MPIPFNQKGNFEPPKPENYFFKGGPEDFKINDTEQKIFEYLFREFKNDKQTKGYIELVSDLKYCDNCYWISKQFQKEFPNIEVIRVFNKEKL